VDLSSLDFWTQPYAERDKVFASLRAAEHPVFCPHPDGSGFYAVTRYDQIVEASRNPRVFSSEPTVTSLDNPMPAVRELLRSMISLDDPDHARLRRIVSRAFTPRLIDKASAEITRLATEIVDSLVERGPCDFVTEVAMPMPLQVICSMMGIPEAVHADVIDATNMVVPALADPDYVAPDGSERATVLFEQITYLHGLMGDLAYRRRARPADDMITALVNPGADGEALTDRELGRFFTLLAVAGNGSTHNTLSHALSLFTEFPDQRDLLVADLDRRLPTAVEEIIRYATPTNWMRRNVTREVDLLGHIYRAGDRVVLYYVSANRDESVFVDPYGFDITRDPNPHLGFGAAGPHFCLGAQLARREITVMLRELFTRLPGLHATASPRRQRSSFVNGITALPCAF
jgi:cytochrome P450